MDSEAEVPWLHLGGAGLEFNRGVAHGQQRWLQEAAEKRAQANLRDLLKTKGSEPVAEHSMVLPCGLPLALLSAGKLMKK